MIQTGIIIGTLVFKCLLPLFEAGLAWQNECRFVLFFYLLKIIFVLNFSKIKTIKPFAALNFLAFSFCACACFIPMILFKTS